jgi:hypothetical protein
VYREIRVSGFGGVGGVAFSVETVTRKNPTYRKEAVSEKRPIKKKWEREKKEVLYTYSNRSTGI